MFEYFLLFLAVVCFAGQFAFTKSYEQTVKSNLVNTLIMLVLTSFFGSLLFFVIGGFKVNFTWFSFVLALLFAVIMLPYFLLGIKALSLGSLAVYSVFMMLGGMLVPFFYGIIFLKESITLTKVLGAILLTVFIVLQCFAQKNDEQNNIEKSSRSKKGLFIIVCLLIFFINGLTGVIAKAHEIGSNPVDETSFVTLYSALTLIMSLLALATILLLNKNNDKINLKPAFKLKPIFIAFLIGASSYTGNFLSLIVAAKVPASVSFPIVSGGVIVLSSIVSRVIYKEKVSKTEWASVVGALISIVLFAI